MDQMATRILSMDAVLVISLIILSIVNSPVSACPSQCHCNATSKHVFCDNSSMVGLPPTIPSDTLSLTIAGKLTSRFRHLKHLQKSDLERMTKLNGLFIYHSDLSTIDEDTFQGLTSMRQVVITGTLLTKIPKGLFNNLPVIDNIDLSGNAHCRLEPGCLAEISSLKYLYLGHMNLNSLEADSFQGLSSLKGLFLEGNGLKTISKDILSPLTSLEVLDISNNDLTVLYYKLEPIFSKLQSLFLSDNPWHCNCETEWLKHLPTVSTARYGTNSLVFCLGPQRHQFKSINVIPSADLVCTPPNIKTCESPVSVEFGTSMALTCTVEGDPIPTLTFICPGRLTVDATHVIKGYKLYENHTFIIENVSEFDYGNWTVEAYNEEGKDVKIVHIDVLNIPTSSSTTTTASTTVLTTSEKTSTVTQKQTTSSTASTTKKATTEQATSSTLLLSTNYKLHEKADRRQNVTDSKHVMTGVILTSVFGGMSLILISIIIGYVVHKRFIKNIVRPLKDDPNGNEKGFVRKTEKPLPQNSSGWV